MGQQLFDDPIEGERTIAGALPDGALAWVLVASGVLVLAWLLAALGTVVGFGGFAVRRERDELRIRRGLLQRRQATLRVDRVRAVRVVESLPRQLLGLAALRVEVIGHAKEQAAAQTLFPLLRRAEVEPFLRELLPEMADSLDGLAAPPPRALRRYALPPLVAHRAAAPRRPRSRSRSPWPLLARAARRRLRRARASAPPAGGWRAAGSRSARAGSPAPPCSPRPPAASRRTSTRRRSSAAPGSPTSPSPSARARSPASATSTPTTPGVCGRRSAQDREPFPMCGGGARP